MACFIVGATGRESWLAPLARTVGDLAGPPTFAADLAAVQADRAFLGRSIVIVADRNADARVAENVVDFSQIAGAQALTVYVADQIAGATYKRLSRGGAAEWIAWEAVPSELPVLLRAWLNVEQGAAGSQVVSVLSSKGGVGNTTVAIEVAVDLSAPGKRKGRKIALLDLDLRGGTLADCLDVEPRLDIDELAGRPDRLDDQLVDVFTSEYAPRLHVFACPVRRAEPNDVDPAVIFAFLDAISARYDVVVLDIPHHGPAWLDNILQGSDAVLVTSGATAPALRQTASELARIDTLSSRPGRTAVVVGQCDADLFGRIRRRSEIDKALAGRRVFYVRRDVASVGRAHDLGKPVADVAPARAVTRDLRAVAEWVSSADGGGAQPPGSVTGKRRGRTP